MNASFTFDVQRAVEELLIRCHQDGHNESVYLTAVMKEIAAYLAEQNTTVK